MWIADKVAGPAIVAVLFAGLTSFQLERYRSKRDLLSKLAEQVRTDLNNLQGLVSDYYARDYDNVKDPWLETEIIVLDREITGAIRVYSEYSKNLAKVSDLNQFLDDFSLAVMSPTIFQTNGRKSDVNQQRLALDAISQLRFLLTQAKLKVLTSIPR